MVVSKLNLLIVGYNSNYCETFCSFHGTFLFFPWHIFPFITRLTLLCKFFVKNDDIALWIKTSNYYCNGLNLQRTHFHCTDRNFIHTKLFSVKRHVIQCYVSRAIKYGDNVCYPFPVNYYLNVVGKFVRLNDLTGYTGWR